MHAYNIICVYIRSHMCLYFHKINALNVCDRCQTDNIRIYHSQFMTDSILLCLYIGYR